jgi:hypothetical protein
MILGIIIGIVIGIVSTIIGMSFGRANENLVNCPTEICIFEKVAKDKEIVNLNNQIDIYETTLHRLSEENINKEITITQQRKEIGDLKRLGCPKRKLECTNYGLCLELMNEVKDLEEKNKNNKIALESKTPPFITGEQMYNESYSKVKK